jgi:hypothetical protein
MADAVRIGSLSDDTTQTGRARHPTRQHGAVSFHHLLARALKGATAAGSSRPGVWRAAARLSFSSTNRPSSPNARTPSAGKSNPATSGSAASSTSTSLPAASDAALSKAMTLEGVPSSWQDGLRFIMDKESSGKVDARNPVHSARGLFQLTQANWHFNPNGAASFGNAVQEAQGGIRYIRQRYGTADNAVTFWQTHHWY